MAQVGILDERKYGRLLGRHRPRIVRSDEEFDRLAAELERLDGVEEQRELDPEERELQALLAHLCTEYEDRTVEPPSSTPLEVLQFLMEQNQLRPADMIGVFGSRSVASLVLSGKRGISKEHARRLAARFRLSVEAFI
ncbi:MAG: transcriptional regulator [Acidobacteria bacterium]|nr:transcriptional regulator [Acidobacteriota bacterium]